MHCVQHGLVGRNYRASEVMNRTSLMPKRIFRQQFCRRNYRPTDLSLRFGWRSWLRKLPLQVKLPNITAIVRFITFSCVTLYRSYELLKMVCFWAHPANRRGNVFGRCIYVYMYVCRPNAITFESIDVVCEYIFRWYGSGSYMKIIGSSARSREPKNANLPIPAMQNFDGQ